MVLLRSNVQDLVKKAAAIRAEVLKMIHNAKGGHTGGSLSSVDILVSLYYEVMNVDPQNPNWDQRDMFILSKGHSVEGFYCVLADRGFFPKEELLTFSAYGTRLAGHPTRHVPGVEVNTGSLGHGLSVGVGMALAIRKQLYRRVYVLLGDGELAEGSVWEAAMAAANYKLDRLTAIIDRNRLQITGETEKVMRLEPLTDKWESFGWAVRETDGHDIAELAQNLADVPWVPGKPNLLIAHTHKGYGVSFIQDKPEWHHRVPTDQELAAALRELGGGRDHGE